jgi:RHS repeat-associated protein
MKSGRLTWRWRRKEKKRPNTSPAWYLGRRPVFELLEARQLLSAVTWDGGGDGTSWTDRFNWSADALPTASDDVTISFAANPTIQLASGTQQIHSLTSNEQIALVGGSLTIQTTATISANLTLAGGTLKNGTVTETGGAKVVGTAGGTFYGGTLDGVTLNGDLDMSGGSARLTVANGLVLNGTATIGNGGAIYFNGTQTLSGTGTVLYNGATGGGTAAEQGLIANSDNMTLTIGAGITIRGGSFSPIGGNSAVIGSSANFVGGSNASVVNLGKISADATGKSITIKPTGTFKNSGIMEAKDGGALGVYGLTGNLGIAALIGTGSLLSVGGTNWVNNLGLSADTGQTLALSGTWTNTAPITANGATLSLEDRGIRGSSIWSNTSTITSTNSTVNLGGTFTTAGLGTFNRTGSIINLTGILDNSGVTLTLDATAGPWSLAGGTLKGGTLTETSGSNLAPTSYGGTLDGVMINGDLDLSATNTQVTIANGLVLNGTATIGDQSRIYFVGTQTLSGAGAIVFNGTNITGQGLIAYSDNMTLTIGAGITIRGGNPYGGAAIGYSGYFGGGFNVSLVNLGKISADTLGKTITINPTRTFTNSGLVEAKNGGSLGISGLTPIADPAALNATPGATIVVNGDVLGNTRNVSIYKIAGQLQISGGSAASPRLLESMSVDGGSVPTSLTNNFAYGTLALASNSYVRLVDQSDNAAGVGTEAVYTGTLLVPSGSTLDLNGLHLYARAAQIGGTIVNGSITQIPDGGALDLTSATPGSISLAAQVDEWTFFGRAQRSITVLVNPGNGSPPSPVTPALNWAQVQLLDSANNVLATAVSTAAGANAVLDSIALQADGIYKIRISAAPGHSTSTGNYVVTAWDTTARVQSLNLNQAEVGTLATPYTADIWKFSATAGQQVQFHPINTSTAGIAFSLAGPDGFSGFTDLSGDSNLLTLPTAGTYTITAHGLAGVIGSYAFNLSQTSVTDLPLNGSYQGVWAGSGEARLFRITIPSPQVLSLGLLDAITTDHTELYAQIGSPPTRENYDYRFTSPGNNQSLVIPVAAEGTWYVLVYGESVTTGGAYTLSATGQQTVLSSVTPDHVGNSAPATLTLTGAGFLPTSTVALVAGNGGTTYAPTNISVDSFSEITATFAAGLPAGTYSVRVTTGASASTLPAAFTVSQGGAANLVTDLILPSVLGRHATATIYIKYANTGTVAMPAPLLVLSNPSNDRPLLTLDAAKVSKGFWTNAIPDGFSTSISILASGKTPGILQPGESVSVPVYYAGLVQPWDFDHSTVPFDLGVITVDESTPIDWNSLKSGLQPAWIANDAWNSIFSGVTHLAGNTSGSYVQMLDDNARALGQLGETVTDLGQLWNFSILQANGLTPVSTLADAVDAQMITPGLSLSFGRSFGNTINSRNQTGILGLGWSVPWSTVLATLADGTVTITTDSGNQFRYQPDSRDAGKYFSAAGDMNVLSPGPGGTFNWKQMDGTITVFRSDGKLSYVQDTNGNRITAGYNAAGQLTNLTHSAGQSLSLTYNTAGRLSNITDSAGRQAIYMYDAANLHLLSVQTPAGISQYGYDPGGAFTAKQNALTSIAFPDGTHRYYTYDSVGLLASTSRDGDAEHVDYTYDQPGEVTATDLLHESTRTYYDNRGLPIKTLDALGYFTFVSYDPATLMVSRIVDSAGQPQAFSYDAMGNIASSTDELGHKTLYTHGDLNRLTSLTDANGNKTAYAYNPAGNLLSTSYTNGTIERATFDPLGNSISFTNRRGQAIGYTYNAAGQVAKQTFPDGSHTDFTYDAHGNLKTAVDATGTITFTYDAADRLTRVDYPDGMYLQFTLDVAGRRIQMVDQTGFTVKYRYDAAGRLSRLTDRSDGLIVTYTYDAAGRLSRKDNGNGTYTTYAYDANGNVLHLINFAPNTTVNSRFDYTYDPLGRRTTMTTLDGSWTYAYDGTGQLTRAIFASTNPAIPNQDLKYNYDAVGNRTSTVENGVTTIYVSNNLNEYTSVGGVTQVYDADGNLVSDGTTTYTYDVLDRLIDVAKANSTTDYAYDSLGNRTSESINGVVTNYLIDPTGIRNVVGEFHNFDQSTAHNVYGLGLTSRITGSVNYYYDFDAYGNTIGLADLSGTYAQSISYSPFGAAATNASPALSPFEFEGQLGVINDPSGIIYARARYYVATTGRFASEDPLGVISPNRFIYALNSPTRFDDPSGLQFAMEEFETSEFWEREDFEGRTFSKNVEDGLDHYRELEAERLQQVLEQPNSVPSHYLFLTIDQYQECLQQSCYLSPNTTIIVDDPAIFPPIDPRLFPSALPILTGPPPSVSTQSKNHGNAGVASAQDPNDKLGPVGYGSQNFVSADQSLPYRIDFENAASATAPAQVVTITDQLPNTIDWNSFRLTEIGFGDVLIAIPDNVQHYQTTVPMTLDGKSFAVLIEAGIHVATGVVYTTFQSLDLLTELPPDVLTGFLPPENGTGRGMGHIGYTVRPNTGLATGTQIRNTALITFDQNQAVATDQVSETDPSQGVDPSKQTLVTLDAVAPTSNVQPLAATETSNMFTVTWSGSDDAGGSGIGTYDVYVSDNGGPFTAWLQATSQTSETFAGQGGHTYRFYSVATDNVGHVESSPGVPDATTMVVPSQASEPGDYNFDGYVSNADYAVWRASFGQIGSGLAADGNSNGGVDAADYIIWRKNTWPIVNDSTGDYNSDGRIDSVDYNSWRSTFGATGANLPADGNHNGIVDQGDYLLWRKKDKSIVVLPGSGATTDLAESSPNSIDTAKAAVSESKSTVDVNLPSAPLETRPTIVDSIVAERSTDSSAKTRALNQNNSQPPSTYTNNVATSRLLPSGPSVKANRGTGLVFASDRRILTELDSALLLANLGEYEESSTMSLHNGLHRVEATDNHKMVLDETTNLRDLDAAFADLLSLDDLRTEVICK